MRLSVFLVCLVAVLAIATADKIPKKIDWSKITIKDPLPARFHPAFEAYPPALDNSNRIIGGEVAPKQKFPHQAGLIINGFSFCGGCLVSDLYILTAAHCSDGAWEITAYLGSHSIFADEEEGREVYSIPYENIIVHPKWDPYNIADDISILQLPRRITFTEYIKPISLPTRTEARLNMDALPVIASGWGRDSDTASSISAYLRYAHLSVQHPVICRHFFSSLIRTTNICTDTLLGQGTCNGDSGGPLIFHRDNDTPYVVGLTSFGSSIGCVIGWPSVFTRVGEYLNWIRDNTDIVIKD